MKHFYRWGFYGLLAVMALFMVVSGVLASVQHEVSYSLEVDYGLQGIGTFSDAAATNTLDRIVLGKVPRGVTITRTIYVKNIGVEPLVVTVSLVPATVSWGVVSVSPTSLGTMTPGQIKPVTFTATVSTLAVTGNYTAGRIVAIGTPSP